MCARPVGRLRLVDGAATTNYRTGRAPLRPPPRDGDRFCGAATAATLPRRRRRRHCLQWTLNGGAVEQRRKLPRYRTSPFPAPTNGDTAHRSLIAQCRSDGRKPRWSSIAYPQLDHDGHLLRAPRRPSLPSVDSIPLILRVVLLIPTAWGRRYRRTETV
uniref:Uncharacterized protein n=1 Tax=Plectus sambesii TaxID=2011161 RepID=A0A914WYH3_9BILA